MSAFAVGALVLFAVIVVLCIVGSAVEEFGWGPLLGGVALVGLAWVIGKALGF